MKIKGFDKNLKCRGFQFEIGKVYDTGAKDDEIKLCSDTVFHYCNSLWQVHRFYYCGTDNRFCEIEVLGAEVADNDKCGSNKIKILREIVGDELDELLGKINGNLGIFNSGEYNSGGYNSGGFNSGSFNSGNGNSGNGNSGNGNSGIGNSGDYNSGDFNCGEFNSCDFSFGFFCTEDPNARAFNIELDMTVSEFAQSKYFAAMHSAPFHLTEWVEYSEEEKANDEEKAKIGGYLKTYEYKEACQNWWNNMTTENREIIMSMPNFDKDIFKEITGIEL